MTRKEKIEALFRTKGFNTHTISRKAKVSRCTLYNLYDETKSPRMDTLELFAKALNMKVSTLVAAIYE